MLRYVTLRYVTLRYVTLRYVTLRYVTLRYVTLRYVTLRYVTLRNKIHLRSFTEVIVVKCSSTITVQVFRSVKTVTSYITKYICNVEFHKEAINCELV